MASGYLSQMITRPVLLMEPGKYSRSSFLSFVLSIQFLVLIQAPGCLSSPDELYGLCSTNFSCGSLSGIGYPFYKSGDPEYCGFPGFELKKCSKTTQPTINIENVAYQVLGINQTNQTMKIARYDVMESSCPHDLVNTTLNQDLFDYVPGGYVNITFLYGCPDSYNIPGLSHFFCGDGYDGVYILPGAQGPRSCNASVVVPVVRTPVASEGSVNTTKLGTVLRDGFEVTWKMDEKPCHSCSLSNGRCVYDIQTSQTTCYCPGQPIVLDTCPAANTTRSGVTQLSPGSSSNKSQLSVVLPVVGAILAGIGIGWVFFYCKQRRKRRAAAEAQGKTKELPSSMSSKPLIANASSNFTASIPSYPSSGFTTEFGRSSYFGTQVFTYEELETATENFDSRNELGDGGFGTVYYGRLGDGREVAVKRLYENNFKRVEQFLNEVEILTKLHHKSLVKLYGCTSRRSRELILVYEYIANGTVADHLHGKLARSGTSAFLSWPVRLNIAIETADALTYLHESDIIHRDVKTNNILLEKNFRVKVADFGLSRLFPNDVTHVSTAPQGTPGYVDPEYYQCYQLTDKSDVYSFGVVLIELISSLQAVDINRQRFNINLANMAINKIQNHSLNELVDKTLGFETDGTVRRTITLVAELAFRCLQQEKDMRPPMKEVLETLRGIQNEDLNVQKAEVLDIVVDAAFPPSPDSGVTDKTPMNGSMPNSTDKMIDISAVNSSA